MPPRRISPDPARGIEPVRTGSEYGMIEGIVGGHVTVFLPFFVFPGCLWIGIVWHRFGLTSVV